MTFSVVVPTKNRPTELVKLIESIMAQTCLPDQLIIIDQSCQKKVIKTKLMLNVKQKGIDINYIHDENITGLVEAKSVSIKYNYCDFISFFDDDIVLESDYFENIKSILIENPSIVGLNGRIINYPKVSLFKRSIFRMTHLGLFEDNRIPNQLKSLNTNNLKKLNVLSGGLSTWNKSVFDKVQFDLFNKFHSYEDQEFSIRVKKAYSRELFLAPKAKLYHNHSEINRTDLSKKYKADIVEVFLIYKKNKDTKFARFYLIILVMGLFYNAVILSISYKKIEIIYFFLKGLFDGIKSQPRHE